MGTLLTNHDVYQLEIFYALERQVAQNVLHFSNNDSLSSPSSTPADDALDCIATFIASCEPNLLDCLTDDTQLTGYRCKRINRTGGPSVVQQSSSVGVLGVAGTISGVGPCMTFSYYDQLSTSERGPAWRAGRIFLPGVGAGQMDNNAWVDTYITYVNNFSNVLRAVNVGPATLHWQFCLWSRTQTAYAFPSSYTLSLKPGIQNRRMKPVI